MVKKKMSKVDRALALKEKLFKGKKSIPVEKVYIQFKRGGKIEDWSLSRSHRLYFSRISYRTGKIYAHLRDGRTFVYKNGKWVYEAWR